MREEKNVNLVFITTIENWEVIKKNNVMGLGGRGNEIFPKIENGDKCVMYIKKICCLSGLFEITNKYSKRKVKWNYGHYQRLLDLKSIIVPNKLIPIKNHVDNLKFIIN